MADVTTTTKTTSASTTASTKKAPGLTFKRYLHHRRCLAL